MRRTVMAFSAALLLGCGGAASGGGALRHAARVDAVVIRALTTERGAELDGRALDRVRGEAVARIAEAVDALPAAEVEQLRLDVSVSDIGPVGDGTRARCLITVSTVGPPERTRAILQGAATVRAHDEPEVAAARGAVRAAIRRLPQALSAL